MIILANHCHHPIAKTIFHHFHVINQSNLSFLAQNNKVEKFQQILCYLKGTAYQITVWKFHDFPITQILHKINFGESRFSKTAIFDILGLFVKS